MPVRFDLKAGSGNLRDARLLVVLLTASVVCVLLFTHRSSINGPWYWKWPWRYISLKRYWIMLASAAPFAAAQHFRSRKGVALAILVLCSMQIRLSYTILQDNRLSLDWLSATVRSPVITSYYSDAAAIARYPQWLADYPQILPLTSLHTQSKPPGPVAYYLTWIRLFGYGDYSAKLAGLGIIVLESLVVPLVYVLSCSLTQDKEVGFAAASFISLCPGAVLITPMLDPVYAGWACLILWAWFRALRSENFVAAAGAGALLAAGTFCSYSLLTLVPFAALQALFIWPPLGRARMMTWLLLVAIAAFVMAYVVLWLGTSFDPIATFESAWHNQHALLLQHPQDRPYPATIVFDLTDFALGMGWVGAAIVLLGVIRAIKGSRRGGSIEVRLRWVLTACAIEPLLIAVAGVLQSETLRVWNFVLPLMATIAGVELVRWNGRARAAAYAAMFVVLLALGQNLQV